MGTRELISSINEDGAKVSAGVAAVIVAGRDTWLLIISATGKIRLGLVVITAPTWYAWRCLLAADERLIFSNLVPRGKHL